MAKGRKKPALGLVSVVESIPDSMVTVWVGNQLAFMKDFLEGDVYRDILMHFSWKGKLEIRFGEIPEGEIQSVNPNTGRWVWATLLGTENKVKINWSGNNEQYNRKVVKRKPVEPAPQRG